MKAKWILLGIIVLILISWGVDKATPDKQLVFSSCARGCYYSLNITNYANLSEPDGTLDCRLKCHGFVFNPKMEGS